MLNDEQLRILQAINDGQTSDSQIVQQTGLTLDVVSYYLEELKKDGFIRVACGRDYEGNLRYMDCQLTSKGKVAATQPDKLLNSSSSMINFSITGSNVNAPIGIFQNSSGNTFNANQDIDTKIAETIKLVDYFYQAVEPLPDNERELSTVHLDNLKEEIQSPNGRNPKKIRAYSLAFFSIVLPAIAFLTNATDFINNATDFAERIGIEIPQLPKP